MGSRPTRHARIHSCSFRRRSSSKSHHRGGHGHAGRCPLRTGSPSYVLNAILGGNLELATLPSDSRRAGPRVLRLLGSQHVHGLRPVHDVRRHRPEERARGARPDDARAHAHQERARATRRARTRQEPPPRQHDHGTRVHRRAHVASRTSGDRSFGRHVPMSTKRSPRIEPVTSAEILGARRPRCSGMAS